MNITLPESIAKLTCGLPYVEDSVGCSDSRVLIFNDMVLKIEHKSELTDRQKIMLRWLDGKIAVPKIIQSNTVNDVDYLLMSKINGKMSCDEEYMNQPELVISALADGLKILWSVEITECPIVHTIDDMLIEAKKHISEIENKQWNGTFDTPEEQLEWLMSHRYKEDFVFSHGDYCMPNVMLENGKVSGFIDMAQCCVADRWYDITMCLQSMERNFSGFFNGRRYDGYDEKIFFEILGITADREKIKFHLLLDELLFA